MNTRPYIYFFFAILVLIIISAIIGNILETKGTLGKLGPNAVAGVKAYFFALFCALVFSLVPLLLRYFVSMQIKAGNGESLIINWLQSNEKVVVYGFWIFYLIGLFIAMPAAVKSGFFK